MRDFEVCFDSFAKAQEIVQTALANHLSPDNPQHEEIYFGVLAEINQRFFEVLLAIYRKQD